MSDLSAGPDLQDVLALAMALPFVPVGVATLLPAALSMGSLVAGFLLL